MTDNFPDISSKIGAPTKKSLFERQKAEAEAKKAREKAETAAVLEDFVKSFDEDGDSGAAAHQSGSRHVQAAGSNFSAGPGKRHFTSTGLKSGPGSLGAGAGAAKNGAGSFGPAQGRKRHYDDFQGHKREHGMFAYEDERRSSGAWHEEAVHKLDDAPRDNETKAAAKPTLYVSALPPGTSPAVIRALLVPSPLVVEDVHILPPPAPSAASLVERRSTSAIITLAAETPATDIDAMVSHLQNKYLGFGFNLSISRHLSSSALGAPNAMNAPSAGLNNLPFGARPIYQHTSLSRAPPPGQNRFAPPASYTSSTPYGPRNTLPPTQVNVQPPSDLKQLKLIHKTLEALLTYGPEFEALLMSRSQVQRDEKWSWLWDSRSGGGVYYRWRLWDILTNGSGRRKQRDFRRTNVSESLFEGQSVWSPPDHGLKFEYVTRLDEFISDDDYDSSDEEAEDEGGIAKRYNDHNVTSAPPPDMADSTEGSGYLNPLAKTKLVHLLSRLPEVNARLRKGDIARLTGFAIEHAGAGADEVAQTMIRNVLEPFCFSKLGRNTDDENQEDAEQTDSEGNIAKQDKSSASLVGLYVISDLLSSSASAGVRHAWRYRSLIDTALRQQRVFEKLGRLDKDLGWGKLKAEKWKRSVQNVLLLWEGWCVFPQTSQDEFADRFVNPPLNEKERKLAAAEHERKEAELRRTKSNSKWKSVEEDRKHPVEDVLMDDVDGVAMIDDEPDGSAMTDDHLDEDVDGVPMVDSSDEGDQVESESASANEKPDGLRPPEPAKTLIQAPVLGRKQRLKAVDMFADDSGGE